MKLTTVSKSSMKKETAAAMDEDIKKFKNTTLALIETLRLSEVQSRLRAQAILEQMEQPGYSASDLAGHIKQVYNMVNRFRESFDRIQAMQDFIAMMEAEKANVLASIAEDEEDEAS